MSRESEISISVEDCIPAEEWARIFGFRESVVVHRIREGTIRGFEKDGAWYVVPKSALHAATVPPKPAAVPPPPEPEAAPAPPASPTTEVARWRSLASEWLAPRYDDLTLFTMSVSALALFAIDADFRWEATRFIFYSDDPRVTFIVFPLFFLGLIFSLDQALTERPRTDLQRELMLYFAVILQAGTGMAAGFHILAEGQASSVILPIWNIGTGFLLLLLYRLDVVTTEHLVEDEAGAVQIALSAAVVWGMTGFAHFVLELNWALTLSMTIALASTVGHAIDLFTEAFGEGR